jgi:hypothetical protein
VRLSASFASAAAARQRLDPLDLFAVFLDHIAKIDVAIQARMRMVLPLP